MEPKAESTDESDQVKFKSLIIYNNKMYRI